MTWGEAETPPRCEALIAAAGLLILNGHDSGEVQRNTPASLDFMGFTDAVSESIDPSYLYPPRDQLLPLPLFVPLAHSLLDRTIKNKTRKRTIANTSIYTSI
jgi:hypothetical protein